MSQVAHLACFFSREIQPCPEIRGMSLPVWFMVFPGRELVTLQRYQAGSCDDEPYEIYPRSRVNSSAGPAKLPVGHFVRPTSGGGVYSNVWILLSSFSRRKNPPWIFQEVCDGAGMKNWPRDFKPWLCL